MKFSLRGTRHRISKLPVQRRDESSDCDWPLTHQPMMYDHLFHSKPTHYSKPQELLYVYPHTHTHSLSLIADSVFTHKHSCTCCILRTESKCWRLRTSTSTLYTNLKASFLGSKWHPCAIHHLRFNETQFSGEKFLINNVRTWNSVCAIIGSQYFKILTEICSL